MRSRWLFACLCLLLTVPLLGCWDLHELNEEAIVTGMAVDKGEKHRFRLTVETMNATELAGKRGTGAAPPRFPARPLPAIHLPGRILAVS